MVLTGYLVHVEGLQPWQVLHHEQAIPGFLRKRVARELEVPQVAHQPQNLNVPLSMQGRRRGFT